MVVNEVDGTFSNIDVWYETVKTGELYTYDFSRQAKEKYRLVRDRY